MRHMCVRCARQACARRPCVAWPLPVSRARRHARPPALARERICPSRPGSRGRRLFHSEWPHALGLLLPIVCPVPPSVHPSPGPPECESIARPDRRRRGHPAPCLPHCFVPAFCPKSFGISSRLVVPALHTGHGLMAKLPTHHRMFHHVTLFVTTATHTRHDERATRMMHACYMDTGAFCFIHGRPRLMGMAGCLR